MLALERWFIISSIIFKKNLRYESQQNGCKKNKNEVLDYKYNIFLNDLVKCNLAEMKKGGLGLILVQFQTFMYTKKKQAKTAVLIIRRTCNAATEYSK